MNDKIGFIGVIASAIALAYWLGTNVGYSEAVADHSTEVAVLAEKLRLEQAEDQKVVNDLAFRYQEAIDDERNRSAELNKTKEQLRLARLRDAPDGCPVHEPDYSHYRLFNEIADSKNLQDDQRTQEPDQEGDGLDAIQYTTGEAVRLKIKVNTLIELVTGSECFN